MNRTELKRQRQLKKRLAQETPSFEFATPSSGHLLGGGAIVLTDVGVAQVHAEALARALQPVPAPIRCRLLIDTGASRSLIRHEIAEKAGLKLMNANQPIHGIGVDTTGRIYLGSIRFAFQSKVTPGGGYQIWVNSEIASGTLPIPDLDGLIGRDVLQFFDFTYKGKAGAFVLRYHKPSPQA